MALPGLHSVDRGAEVAFERVADLIAEEPDCKVTVFGSGPVPLDVGDLAEVSSKHRRRAKLRRQHWSEVTESACETIRGHLATRERA